MMTARRRVVITGLGVVTPLGCGAASVWERLCAGTSGVGTVSAVDKSLYTRNRAAQVKEFDFLPEARDKAIAAHGRAIGYAVAAAREALDDAKLSEKKDRRRVGVLLGTTMGSLDIVERVNDTFGPQGGDELSNAAVDMLQAVRTTHLGVEVARRFGLGGPMMLFPTACAAGNVAVSTACDLIGTGRANVVLAGGADPFSRTAYTIFYRLGASSPDACRPFDAARTGMIVGDGAGMLVLEELEHARARGAAIYGEISGSALACDAYHRTSPHPEGRGAVQAMRGALTQANLHVSDIDYISAHGTGTRANDSSEAIAMSQVFGDRISNIPVSSIKSMIGHCMGAASAIEAVACALAVTHGIVPPTATSDTSDPEFPVALDIVPRTARTISVRHAMSNAFAFGGCISSIIISRFESKATGVLS